MDSNNKNLPQVLFVMGIIGSGKNTQCDLLIENYGYHFFSIGQRLRDHMAEGSLVGEKIREFYESGDLAPEWLAEYFFMDSLFKLEKGERLISEGGAKKLNEARLADEILTWLGIDYKVIHIEVSEEEARRRMIGRSRDEADKNEEITKVRLQEFRDNTIPALAFFEEKGRILVVDGEKTVEEIHEEIVSVLENEE